MLKLSTKCWIPPFNAQGSRGIIVAVQVVAMKIYVGAVEALMKKERQGETQGILMVFWFHPLLNANVLFCSFFFNLTLCMTKLRVLVLPFPDFMAISNVYNLVWTPCIMHRCVYLTVHIAKLQLQTTFPKLLYIQHFACIHWDPGRWKSWCLHCLWPMR